MARVVHPEYHVREVLRTDLLGVALVRRQSPLLVVGHPPAQRGRRLSTVDGVVEVEPGAEQQRAGEEYDAAARYVDVRGPGGTVGRRVPEGRQDPAGAVGT